MPPRATKASGAAAIKPNTLVIDNGAWTIKAGLVRSSPALAHCHIVQNCLARDQDRKVYVGPQLDQCKDFFHLVMRRPVEHGMIVNWEHERAIWHQTFLGKDAPIQCDPHETNLILAEAPNVFPVLQNNCDQIVFEEFEFASYYRGIGPSLNAYTSLDDTQVQGPAECRLVVDSGYSHSTITPLLNGKPVQNAIRRLDVGGKHLTNYLTELLAVHEVSLTEDPWIANEVKETCCYVTDNFKRDTEKTWRGNKMDPSVVIDVQLPDYQEFSNVVVKPYESRTSTSRTRSDIATLGNERFQVPELLFDPGDIGMTEAGLPELIMQSIAVLPEAVQPAMYHDIWVVGGNARIPGFMDRLRNELRQLVPTHFQLHIHCPADPVKATWWGGICLAADEKQLQKQLVTRAQYFEHGSSWLSKRFNGISS